MNAVDIASSQRSRLLAAMATVVAEKGYAATTVADVVGAAGVCRSTFYALFASKEACFLDAYSQGVEVPARRASRGRPRRRPATGARSCARASAPTSHALAGEPRFARIYLDEIHAAGAAALAARADALRRFADRYQARFSQARAADPTLREPASATRCLSCAPGPTSSSPRACGRAATLRELEDVFCTCAEAVLTPPDPGGLTPWT